MPDLRSRDRGAFYICGKCKGKIFYEIARGRPRICPECGYGHGERPVNDIPSTVRLNLNEI